MAPCCLVVSLTIHATTDGEFERGDAGYYARGGAVVVALTAVVALGGATASVARYNL